MDEMSMLKELGQELGSAGGEPTAQTRRRVLDGATARGAGSRLRRAVAGGGTGSGRWEVDRFGVRGRQVRSAIPVGAAAAVVLVGGLGILALPGPAAGRAVPASGPDRAGFAAPVTQLSAEQILLAAAVTARAGDDRPPPARAFVYTRSEERSSVPTRDDVRESWLSVDGSRSGAVTPSGSSKLEELPGCVNGRPRIEDGQGGWMACKPDPAYRANFPTTPAGARKELYHNDFVGSDHHDDASAFEKAGDLLMERRLPPAARAAVFVALATISGTTVVPDAVTATGAVGVAVARVDAGRTTRDELIFDPVAHTLIGRRSILLPGGSRPMVQPPGIKATVQTTREGSQVTGSSQGAQGGTQEDSSRPGTVRSEVVLYSTGVLESAIVSRVGLRPDGTVRAGVIEPAFTK